MRNLRSLVLLVGALVLATFAAVPALAGGGKAHGSRTHAKARPAGHTRTPYQQLAYLRRLGRKAPPGTHSKSAAIAGQEMTSLRTSQSKTFVRADGTYVTRTYPMPVNFRDSRGHFQPIDNRLVPVGASGRAKGYAFENAANSYRSFLPENLSSPVLVAAHGSWVSLRMIGADAGGGASGDTGGYAGVAPGVDASYQATNSALKETLTLADANAQRSFTYVVHASRNLRARRNADGSIAFVTRRGRVKFGLPAPFVYDQAQKADGASYSAVSQRLRRAKGGYVLTLRVKRSYLRAGARQFPVTVDPTVSYIEDTGDTRQRQQPADLDCYIRDGASAGTNVCAGSQQLHVGWDGSTQRRFMIRFDVQNSLPKGIHVLDAELGLYMLDNDVDGTTATINVHRMTRSWTGAASWNKYDGTNNWTTAGGDYDPSVAASNTVGAWGQWYKWFPRQLVQGWVDGSITNNGVMVKEAAERSLNNRFFFWSSAAPFSQLPYLDVIYEPQTGQRPYYKFVSDQLTDRMDMGVNVASGNFFLHANDVNIKGTGLDLGVDRYYNSMMERDTGFGEGWTMGSGADVRLRITSDAGVLYAPSGYVVSFPKTGNNFSAPKGIDATLCLVNGTTCKGQSTYALTYNHSQIRNNFDSSGKLVSQRDQNNNEISFTYDAGGKLTQIKDTQNRVLTVTNPTNRITQLTDSSGRAWQYTYDTDGHLSTYTDPEGKVTTYKWNAQGLIREIDDPRGGVIWIWYDTTAMRRVTRTQRVNDNGPDKITDYAYSGPTSPCQSSDFGKTVVTDANSHATTYCYDDQGKVKTIFDAKGKKQKLDYSPNFFVQQYTSANNATSGFNTTVDRDSNSNSVKTVTQATGGASGDPNMTSSFTYNGPTSQSFSPFYPDTSKNTQGNSHSYIYDANGNLSRKTDSTSGVHVDLAHGNAAHPGLVTQVTDGNGNATQYGYDTPGNLTTITPPTLLAGTGTQPGTTTIAYDSISRPCVVTDGKTQRTAYTYDKLDRVKSIVKYNAGTTLSGCTVTGTPAKTVTLTYDNNGSLTQRVDPNGTTTYAYNELNRLNSQLFPGGRQNSYIYDPVGNLTTLTDASGNTVYAYDVDNLLASVAEPGGSCTATPKVACTTFTVDDDGNRTKTNYPNGIVLTNDYDASGRLTCTMATNGAPTDTCAQQTSPLRRTSYNYVDSSDEANVHETALRQSSGDGSGTTTSYSYDSLDRLKTATTRNPSGTVTDDYTYTYDNAGNMTSRVAKANSGSAVTTTFTYNKANELCWSFTGTSANPCATKPTGAVSYTYDANGNQLVASSGRAYTYNVFDQTISLTGPTGGTVQTASYLGPNQSEMVTGAGEQYSNNVLGTGLKVYSDATVSYFTRDVSGALLGERAPGGAKYYVIPDGLGSTVATTGSNGAIVNTYKYDPYGAIVSASETSAKPTSFRYAGGLYSSSVGLHKFGNRWYDQTLDRWTQQDPIDQTGDLKQGNRYLYVGDNPMNGTDPSGSCFLVDCSVWNEAGAGAVTGAIGGFVAGLPEGGVGAIPGAIVGAGEGAAVGAAGGLAKQAGVPSNVVDTATIFYGSGRIVHDFTKSVGRAINDLP